MLGNGKAITACTADVEPALAQPGGGADRGLQTGRQWQLAAAQLASVVDFCRDNRLIDGRAGGGRRFGTTITLCPPLVIARAECDRIVDTLRRALQILDLS